MTVESLDRQISTNELEKAISKLKINKACGQDGIINEFIKHSNVDIYNVILRIFNTILDTGFFPSQWSVGVIVPVHKKGDVNDPLNYRGITLVSCLGKLFTNIINERLNVWAEEMSILSENQFGFRKQKSTTDCIFILQGLIEHFFNNSKQLYCSFVDLTRAFDGLDRNALWYKLNFYGVSSKLITVIKNMYGKIKLCVKNSYVDLNQQIIITLQTLLIVLIIIHVMTSTFPHVPEFSKVNHCPHFYFQCLLMTLMNF